MINYNKTYDPNCMFHLLIHQHYTCYTMTTQMNSVKLKQSVPVKEQ